jgi:hypothetical protein
VGILLTIALLVQGGVEVSGSEPAVEATVPRLRLIQAGAGLQIGNTPLPLPLALVVHADIELSIFESPSFVVAVTFRGLWVHGSWVTNETIEFDDLDALVGLRLGGRFGTVFEIYFSAEAGPSAGWLTTSSMFSGWSIWGEFGVGVGASIGARFHIGQRMTIFVAPCAVIGRFHPLATSGGNSFLGYFAPTAGLAVRL